MSNLRLLMILSELHLPLGLKCLPNALKVLVWREYPLESLPLGTQLDELVDLDMCHSKIKHLWRGTKFLGNLKAINLRNSKDLNITPDLTGIPNLEKLDLEGCINLVKVHASFGLHKKLTYVTLEDCKNLKILPRKLEMNSLKRLILSGCSMVRKLPEFGENMKNISMLALEETAIAELPLTLGYLTGLNSLIIAGCKNIVCLPNTISNLKSLKRLNISGCSKFSKLPDNLKENEALECLNVSETAIREVPSSIVHLTNLRLLIFRGCEGLASNSWSSLLPFKMFGLSRPIPKRLILPSFSGLSSLEKLDLSYCNLHDGSIPDDLGCLSSLITLDLSGNNFVHLPAGCISKLLKLERLLLKCCPSLESLPRLPPNVHYVNASDCGSMKSLSDPQQIWDHLRSFDFDKMQDANHLKTLLVCPGNEIPSSFFYQNYFDRDIQYLKDKHIWADSTVSISMDLAQLRHRCGQSKWWGIVVCLVLEDLMSSSSQDHRVRVGWISKVPTIENFLRQLTHNLLEHGYISGIPKHEYPHILVLYIPVPPSRWSYVQDKFQLVFFTSSLKSKLVIKRCGWRVLCNEDAEVWRKKKSECNTAASASQCVPRDHSLSSPFASWRWIRCLKVPQHCKTFLLAILCDRLPANARCRFCSLEESIIHVLRDCRRACAIWIQMVPSEVHDEFFSTPLHDWMHRFLLKPWLPNNQRDHDADCLRFTITTWLLWNDTNNSIFKGDSLTDDGLYSLIQSLVHEYTGVLLLNGEEGSSAVSSVSQNSRLKHFIKLNVDGCSTGNPGNAGYGGLFRDVEGKWLGGFYGSLGFTTNMQAELYAICQGLITAWDLDYRFVVVETDSLEAIHLIEANIENHAYGSLLADIRSLMQRNWSVELIHFLREDSACADILAKLGAEQHEVYCFLAYPPQQLQRALMADALHVQLPCR